MNRLICRSSEPVDKGALPPPSRGRGAPARVLFLHATDLGFGTTTRNLIRVAEARPDIDAVHCTLEVGRLARHLMRQVPLPIGRWDMQATRMIRAWDATIRRVVGPGERFRLPLERFDAVHVMTQQRALWITRHAGAGRPRFVVNADATAPAFDAAFELASRAPSPERGLERRIFQAADAVACSSRWVADSVESDHGVPAAKIFLHMPCVFAAPRSTDRSGRADPSRPVRIVFVGNDWDRKGGPRLLTWHQQRWSDRAELHVCSSKAPVDRGARSVVWHGATPHDRLINQILPTMDLMVIPTFQDTFLIAAQEAQALGLPVVTSRLAGIPEVVADGVGGLLCGRHDDAGFVAAVDRLIGDAELRARLSRGAREHASRNLDAGVWHNHLMDQLVRLSDGLPVRRVPGGLSSPEPVPTGAATANGAAP